MCARCAHIGTPLLTITTTGQPAIAASNPLNRLFIVSELHGALVEGCLHLKASKIGKVQ